MQDSSLSWEKKCAKLRILSLHKQVPSLLQIISWLQQFLLIHILFQLKNKNSVISNNNNIKDVLFETYLEKEKSQDEAPSFEVLFPGTFNDSSIL